MTRKRPPGIIRIAALASLILAATPFLGRADEVTIRNGSVLKGRITRIDGGTLSLATEFAGTIKIDQKQISGVKTDSDCFVALESGSTLLGRIIRDKDGQMAVKTVNGAMIIGEDAIRSLWREGDDSPEVRRLKGVILGGERKWHTEIGIDIAGKTGTTESSAYGGKFEAILKSPHDRLRFHIDGGRSKQNRTKTRDQVKAGIDYEWAFSDLNAWYVLAETAHDDIAGLSLRSTAVLGYSRYLVKSERHELRGRTGLSFRHESYKDGRNDQVLGLEAAVINDIKLGDWGQLKSRILYRPSFEDYEDFRGSHESSLDLPFSANKNLSLSLGLTNDYNSRPGIGVERLDTIYFLRLVLELN